jgi:hypothetical protein
MSQRQMVLSLLLMNNATLLRSGSSMAAANVQFSVPNRQIFITAFPVDSDFACSSSDQEKSTIS